MPRAPRSKDHDATARALLDRGEAAEERGDHEAALAAYDRALAAATATPLRARAHLCRGSLRDELDDLDGALGDYDAAVALVPDDPDARYLRGLTHQARESWREALADLDAAIALDATRTDYLEVRGEVLFNLREWARARADWARVIAHDPDHDPKWHFWSGMAAVHLGLHVDAIADFSHTVAAEPHQPRPLYERAKAYEALGRFAEALSDVERVHALVPDDPIVASHRARLAARGRGGGAKPARARRRRS